MSSIDNSRHHRMMQLRAQQTAAKLETYPNRKNRLNVAIEDVIRMGDAQNYATLIKKLHATSETNEYNHAPNIFEASLKTLHHSASTRSNQHVMLKVALVRHLKF